jgi:hypothetical protein
MRLPSVSTCDPSRSRVGGVADRAGDAADARGAPFGVEGVGVLHVEIRLGHPDPGFVIGLGGEVQTDVVAIGEPYPSPPS